MTTYSRGQRLEAITRYGFADPIRALAVSLAEFGENRDIETQGQSDARYSSGAREESYGPWQIHLPAHQDVTRACALDLDCSTQYAAKISKGGTDFGPWSAFTNGSYQRFVAELQSLIPSPPPVSGGGSSPDAGGTGSTPTDAPDIDPDLLRRIRLRLGSLLVLRSKGGINEAGIASTLEREFPQVPLTTLRSIVSAAGESAVRNIDNAPVLGGATTAVRKTTESADAFRAWIENAFAAENLWRAGVLALGAAMIFFGARLYFHADSASEQVMA